MTRGNEGRRAPAATLRAGKSPWRQVNLGFVSTRGDDKLRAVRTWIVANPTAQSGRALTAGRALASLVPDSRLHETMGPGDATRLAREAHDAGVENVVAVGGDGTVQEIVAGLCLDADGNARASGPRLGLLPAGTGGDYRRSHGLSSSIEQAATRLAGQRICSVDIGRVELVGHSGAELVTAFANALSFGLGGLTDRLVESAPKWIGGRAAFYLGAFRANLLYRPVPLEIEVDARPLTVAPYSNVSLSIGKYMGGGMKMAPHAQLDDGLFDIVTLEASKLQTIGLTMKIYQGSHLQLPICAELRGRTIRARATRNEPVLVDVDGNQLGFLPLRVDMMERCLSVLL